MPPPDYPFPWPTPVDPPRLFDEIRERAGVCPVTMPSGEVGYLVSRYADARRVLTDASLSLAALWRPGAPRFAPGPPPPVGFSLATLDPPEHARVRGVVSRSFTVGRVEAMRPDIRRLTDRLLDDLVAAGPPADLVAALCARLPSTIACWILGVPERDHDSFRDWAWAISSGGDSEWEDAWRKLGGYLVQRIAERRRGKPGDDLLGHLAGTLGRHDGLTDFQLATLAAQVITVGNESVRNQLATIVYVLLRQPGDYARLCADPGRIPATIEELLRLHPPNDHVLRAAVADVRVGDTLIPAGSGVLVEPAAANRDPATFSDPGKMDVGRTGDGHLTFGHGTHFCLGAALARAELQIAVSALVRRFPRLRLAVPPENVHRNGARQVIDELPVAW